MRNLKFLTDIEVYRLTIKVEKGEISARECVKKLKARAQESLLLSDILKDQQENEFEVPF